MAEAWDDPRFDKEWGTRQEVYAAWLAGWDIELGPPPNTHALPPEIDPELGHNGVPAPKPGDPDWDEFSAETKAALEAPDQGSEG